jgi:hypothetical protein
VTDRDKILDLYSKALEDYETATLTLGGAALTASIAFIKDIAPDPRPFTVHWVVLGWLSLGLSIGLSLVSKLLGHSAIEADLAGRNGKSDCLTRIVTVLNWLITVTLIGGFAFLGTYAAVNLGAHKKAESHMISVDDCRQLQRSATFTATTGSPSNVPQSSPY